MAERDRAGVLGKCINTFNKTSQEPERPVASVRGVQDVTERPWNEVIVGVVGVVEEGAGTPLRRSHEILAAGGVV